MKFAINIATILFLLISSAGNAQLTLRFQPEVTEQASRLGDILIIKNTAPRQQPWSTIPLESHPGPGEIITKEKLIDWLTQKVGPFQSTWEGKTKIQVKKPHHTSEKVLIKIAKKALFEQLKTQGYINIKVSPISRINDSNVGFKDIKANVKLSYPTPKRVCVWLSNKDNLRTAVWFKVRAYANVLVSNQNIQGKKHLDSRAFSLKKRDISGLKSLPLSTLPNNKWLKYPIYQNTILQEKQLKEAPLVEQGQHVKVITQNHHINIAIEAIALTDGYLDETIQVKNTLNQTRLSVRVTGFQQAEL